MAQSLADVHLSCLNRSLSPWISASFTFLSAVVYTTYLHIVGHVYTRAVQYQEPDHQTHM